MPAAPWACAEGAARDQPLLAIVRSDANGCSVALCQRRQPPKAGAVGQRLQRAAGQPSLNIKSDGWFSVAAGPTDPSGPMGRRFRPRNGLCVVYARIVAAADIA